MFEIHTHLNLTSPLSKCMATTNKDDMLCWYSIGDVVPATVRERISLPLSTRT